jgi:hypothetical protein
VLTEKIQRAARAAVARVCAASVALTAMLGAGAVAQTLPFEGKWALRLDRCTAAASPTEPGQPITLSAAHLIAAPFMTCDFTSVLPGGSAFRVAATCDGAGRKGDEFFTFAVLDGRLYWSWAEKTQVFERCPEQP